ncbi:MAG: outer membrane beta-barrel protein [Bacteroidota bacterium]|nr:outer membrane beta-barrel protein [Bacteroidota bacterium]
MMTVSTRFSCMITLLLVLCAGGSAQWRAVDASRSFPDKYEALPVLPGGENVFSPEVSSIFVSGYIGVNHNTNMGSFRTDCDCNFEGAFNLKNIGALIGVDATYQFHPNWAVMAKVSYDNKHTKEAYTRVIATPIKLGNIVRIHDIEYEESGSVSLAYVSMGVFGRWQPRLERWYVFAGPSVGLPISNRIRHDQAIVTPEVTYQEIGISERKREVSTATFESEMRLEAMVGFGYDYIVRPRWFVNPEIRVGYPVTKITNTVTDRGKTIDIGEKNWKVLSVQFSIGLKYEAF